MKVFLILLCLLSTSVFAKTDWKAVYENMENKDERLKLEDFIEACEQGVEDACRDGWRNHRIKVSKNLEIIDYSVELYPEYLSLLKKICSSDGLVFCLRGLQDVSDAINSNQGNLKYKINDYESQKTLVDGLGERVTEDEKKKLNELKISKEELENFIKTASELFSSNTLGTCEKLLLKGSNEKFCQEVMEEHKDEKEKFINTLKNECLSKKDFSTCNNANSIAVFLNSSIGEVCKDPEIEKLSICEHVIAAKERAVEEEKSSRVWTIIFFIVIALVVIYKVKKTQCSECKKYFAFEVTDSKHAGTTTSEHTRKVEIGESKDSHGNVTTHYQNEKYTVATEHYVDTHSCKYCTNSYKTKRAA